MRGSHGSKEMVDGSPFSALLFELGKPQVRINRAQVRIRRDYINVIGLDRDGARHLLHWDLDVRLQEIRQMTLVLRREVHDDDESQTAVGRHMTKEGFERVETAGRRRRCRRWWASVFWLCARRPDLRATWFRPAEFPANRRHPRVSPMPVLSRSGLDHHSWSTLPPELLWSNTHHRKVGRTSRTEGFRISRPSPLSLFRTVNRIWSIPLRRTG